jgi:Fic family protein
MAKQTKEKNETILDFIKQNPLCSSKTIHDELSNEYSYATIKRILQQFITENLIIQIGNGRGTKYEISQTYNLFREIKVNDYFEKEIDEREIRTSFNFMLINEILEKVSLFTNDEMTFLISLQNLYIDNTSKLSEAEYKKEMERLAIDLSWKSSQIEGNTYSLLETELLLKEKETAFGKTKDEATMLLNHKAALDFLIENPTYVKPLTISSIEDIHSILIQDLGIDRNIRNKRVGISGTNYKPIDNEFQIKEAFEKMCILINKKNNIFEKALLVLVLISYIQGFADGNKRTARIISNAILMNYNYCPISYRTVNSIEYKKAMLIFYEQNNINSFKEIFIKQFEFAVNTYF